MAKKKLGIREILALNLKVNRQKCGLTQEKLAEKAGISPKYLSMIEMAKKFPTPEMLDRLAGALEIDTIQLFAASGTPEERALLNLQQSILENINKQQLQATIEIKKTVINAVQELLRETRNGETKPKRKK